MSTSHRSGNGRTVSKQSDEVVDQLVEHIKSLGCEARDAVEQKLRDVRGVAEEYIDSGREQAAVWERTLEEQIVAKPIKTLLIASACAFVLGMVVSRR